MIRGEESHEDTHIRNRKGRQNHKDLTAPIPYVGCLLKTRQTLLLGRNPNWEIFRVFLYIYALFPLLSENLQGDATFGLDRLRKLSSARDRVEQVSEQTLG